VFDEKISVIITDVLYERSLWVLALKGDSRLRALENRVLKKIFGPKGEDVKRLQGKLWDEEVHNF
jgi:hypothetical protein